MPRDAIELICGPSGASPWPSAAAPANDISLLGTLRELYDQKEKAISTAAAGIANGTSTIITSGGARGALRCASGGGVRPGGGGGGGVAWVVGGARPPPPPPPEPLARLADA